MATASWWTSKGASNGNRSRVDRKPDKEHSLGFPGEIGPHNRRRELASSVCGWQAEEAMMMFCPGARTGGIVFPRSLGTVVVGSGWPIGPAPKVTFMGLSTAETLG